MALKRLSNDELLRLQKKARVLETDPPVPPPSSESGAAPKSSTSGLRREAVEEFKNSAEFAESMDLARSHAFIEGFYACSNWLGHISPQYDLSRICFFVIPPCHRYLPNCYLERAEQILAEKLEDDAAAALPVDPAEEIWEALARVDTVPVVPGFSREEEEEEKEREEPPFNYNSRLSDEAEEED